MDLADKADNFIGEQASRTYSEKEVIEMMRSLKNKSEERKAFTPSINALSKKISKIGMSTSAQATSANQNSLSTSKKANSEIVQKKNSESKSGKSGRLIEISIPQPLSRTDRNRRKFSIHIHYLDESGKKRATTVRFGDHDKTDYYEHKDETKRLGYINRLKHSDDPFHQNFWIANLLNGKSSNLTDNYNAILSSFGMGL